MSGCGRPSVNGSHSAKWVLLGRNTFMFSPAGHLRRRRQEPIVGFHANHGEQVSDGRTDNRSFGLLQNKKMEPPSIILKTAPRLGMALIEVLYAWVPCLLSFDGSMVLLHFGTEVFWWFVLQSTSPWLAGSIQSLPAGLPCRAVHGWY